MKDSIIILCGGGPAPGMNTVVMSVAKTFLSNGYRVIGLHYAWPKTAEKVDKVLTKLAFPLLLVLITVFYIQHRHTIMDNIGVLGLCVTALILLAIGLSSLLSRLVRNDARQRRTVVIEVGMQNAAQAISIASSPFIFANEEMAIPAILYSLMMNIVLLTYVGIVKKKKEL